MSLDNLDKLEIEDLIKKAVSKERQRIANTIRRIRVSTNSTYMGGLPITMADLRDRIADAIDQY